VEDQTEGKGLHEGHEAEDGPVGEPLDVVLGLRGLDRLEGEVGGEGPANEVGNGCGKDVDRVEEHHKSTTREDEVGLGHLSALLSSVEDGVFGELIDNRIELANCVVR
jgi:hypothetical protein